MLRLENFPSDEAYNVSLELLSSFKIWRNTNFTPEFLTEEEFEQKFGKYEP